MNKRIISLLLVLAMAFGLAACGAPAAPAAPASGDVVAKAEMQFIEAEDAKNVLNDEGYIFFDLRKAADVSANTIPGALAYDMTAAREGDEEAGKTAMTEATKDLDKNVVLICYSGKNYAQTATNALAAIGYDMSKVFTLKGGFNNWSEVYPELTTAGGAAEEAPAAPAEEKPEVSVVRWNWGTSANVLVALALEKGYFAEYGLEIEFVNANENASAMTLLATGQVDVVSNSGTASPLQNVASGVDMTFFGGHMMQGCMPVIARKGTEWNGITSLVGEDKKVAINPSYFAFTGALMEAGVEDPMTAVNWVAGMSYPDALAAVQRGEIDYALMGTGQNFQVQNMEDIEILCYQGDVMPNYSCCRMECPTEFIEKNPIAIKCILKALIRAQADFEADKEACVPVLAKAINADNDYVAAYLLNDYLKIHVDPLSSSIVRAWGILDKTGFLDENAKNINIEDHINTSIYAEALAECEAEYGAQFPEFYKAMNEFFAANNG